uniref:Uncharacterized protein n=1 Tax=Anguilla anguilla TaxID=7936 RepID=A0A0E9PBV2_ANGAN
MNSSSDLGFLLLQSLVIFLGLLLPVPFPADLSSLCSSAILLGIRKVNQSIPVGLFTTQV